MRYPKRPLSFDEQIELLILRGLQVSDPDRAKRWLSRISYYRLSAYFLPFKIRDTDTYRTGSTFEDVIDLYKFDARLRVLVIQAIERIEVAVRSTLVYEMAHGLGLYAYADVTNFSPHFNHLKMMEGIATDEQRSRESFVEHFRSKYTSEPYLPIWMVTELISFGALSTMYSGLRRSLQRRIADEFGVPEGAFRTWLHTLNYVRNSCAHHNRLWNRKLAIKPALPHKWPYLTPENDKLYTVLVVMLHMLGYIAPKCRWKDRTMHLLLEHPRVPLRLMGFPENWATLWPWSLSEI